MKSNSFRPLVLGNSKSNCVLGSNSNTFPLFCVSLTTNVESLELPAPKKMMESVRTSSEVLGAMRRA